jgi:hypothetical protein
MSDDGISSDSGLGGFLFYILFVYPCTSFILKPGRFPRGRSIMYAISFLGKSRVERVRGRKEIGVM